MIGIRLKGGLGNQMFQYAFAKGVAKRLDTEFRIDCTLLLDRARQEQVVYRDFDLDIFDLEKNFTIQPKILRILFKIRYSIVGRVLRKITLKGKTHVKEKHFHVDQNIIDNPCDEAVFEGWWQSSKYWDNVEEELRTDFAFKDPILSSSLPLLQKIEESNAVCLNVRRTDFVTNPTLNTTNLDYFDRSVQKIASMAQDPHFFIFSDDLEWCEKNLQLDYPTEFVPHSEKGRKFSNYLRLMSACKHFIIPNSSFAWWAVWLSNKENQVVIAPKNWFNEGDFDTSDLVPDSWIRI